MTPTIPLLTAAVLYFSAVDLALSFVVPTGDSLGKRSTVGGIITTIRTESQPTEQLQRRRRRHSTRLFATVPSSSSTSDVDSDDSQNDDDDDDVPWYDNLDILQGGSNGGEDDDEFWYGDDTLEDWIPDADRATRKPTHLTPAKEVLGEDGTGKSADAETTNESKSAAGTPRKSPYTDEEEELIEAMGGKNSIKQSKREEGFLGDSTLKEIATDYSVPICYLADVLCMWKVPVPINIHDRLGDMVTGEQAFALVEAIHTLDVGALHDRYSNENMLQVCAGWDIDINDAFQFAMKEGWSLPFGVRTNLRVEQEDELLRVFSTLYHDDDDDDEY